MRTAILCGGRGTRALPHTAEVPKPLLEVGGSPVLRHVMDIYARQGHTDFVLAAGFQHQHIADFAADLPASWAVEVVDTGEGTATGERVRRVRDLLDQPFFLTYADGLGDVDLAALAAFHDGHAGLATLTTVPLPSPYGTVESTAVGQVTGFVEKPQLPDHRINAGFFAMDPAVFDRWSGVDLEREVLPALGAAGELYAFEHQGFWRSMDTYKDALELTALCGEHPPWLR